MFAKPKVPNEIRLVTLIPKWVMLLGVCHYVRVDLSSRRENVIRKKNVWCLQIINRILQNVIELAYISGNNCFSRTNCFVLSSTYLYVSAKKEKKIISQVYCLPFAI